MTNRKKMVFMTLEMHAAHVNTVKDCPWCAKSILEDIIDDEGMGTSMGLWNAWKGRANNTFRNDPAYPDVLRAVASVDPEVMELVMQADSE